MENQCGCIVPCHIKPGRANTVWWKRALCHGQFVSGRVSHDKLALGEGAESEQVKKTLKDKKDQRLGNSALRVHLTLEPSQLASP